jgi:hypothetical protein
MLSHISWAAYLTTAAVTLFFWYAFIGLKYYINDIRDFLNGKRKHQFEHVFSTGGGEGSIAIDTLDNVVPKGTFEEPALNDFETIEELVDRVKTLISEALEKKMPKEGFLVLLGKLLRDYPALLKSQFRPSVNEFITSECEVQGLAPVSENELEELWNSK